MNIVDRFLEYIAIDTESCEENAEIKAPSSACQLVLAKLLAKQLEGLGAQDVEVSEYGVVYAHFPATEGLEKAPSFGCIAHMDTVLKGKGIKARVIENYDGKEVTLANGLVLSKAQNPDLELLAGRTLIVTDGTTILGADDKAGVTAIMDLCERLAEQNLPHGKLCVAFTPDEEIGCGVDHFELDKFGADYAVTVDGGAEWIIEYENFNAAHVNIVIEGVDTHPGSAKDVMVNAAALLCEYQSRLPKAEVPERTSGREGFYHLTHMTADVELAKAEYLIREFDREVFEKRKVYMQELAKQMNAELGKEYVSVTIKDSYYNMAEIVQRDPQIVDNIENAIRKIGMEPVAEPIRGGTDGCRLSFEGLPCPNIGAGGYMFHSIYEHCTKEGMENASRVLEELLKIYAEA